jgi:hypothetical protein
VADLIQSKGELISYLTTKQIANKYPPVSVNVTTALRKTILTDADQGRFINKGESKSIEFKSIGGGVYVASIKGQ